MVRDFQSVIGYEARDQFLEMTGIMPDAVCACVGGGSNSLGMFVPFLADPVEIYGIEPLGRGNKEHNLNGGHIILLNKEGTEFYEETKTQALNALSAYPGGMQIGGGINDTNASFFIEAGASHVIVTSFVFQNGQIYFENLEKINRAVGKDHLVLDLSCRYKNGEYVIVTDRWQKDTDFVLNQENLALLASYSDEFLIHAVDVEGKMGGIEGNLAKKLGKFHQIPITYAGGIHSFSDLDELNEKGNGRLDATIGSALSLFGGPMKFEEVLAYFEQIKE